MSGLATLIDRIFSNGRPLHDPTAHPAGFSTIKSTTCYMCACRCGINVHVRDGEVRYIEGNPNHPLNHGVICAKGSAGIMKQVSPARLTQPLRRKPGAERGAGEFEPITWDEALRLLEERLRHLRATDPKQFALFTGRDQMQALTGLFAREFGTPNYAAHGGFCSVNMAAGMIYTTGGSFWEFGGPDLKQSRLFVMIGTAEDHHSNPLKLALSDFKRAGGRFISINPVRSGYSAVADEWIPIRPGTDGALFMALLHELLRTGRFDAAHAARYTNAAQLVRVQPGHPEDGLMVRNPEGDVGDPAAPRNAWWWDAVAQQPVPAWADDAQPALFGHYRLPDGTPVATALQLLREQVADCTPTWAATITGISAARITQLAEEMAEAAIDQAFDVPQDWTDAWGRAHSHVTARPLAFHAMRGLAAHSNGFQTIRALAVLMSLLGTIDAPGGFRHKPPYPKQTPPGVRTARSWSDVQPNTPLHGAPLGWPAGPDDLMVDEAGRPMRIDKAFSWEHPLAVHGLMHNVITNAWRGDPYPIDTLLIFMSNMAWNSAMNTQRVRRMLTDKRADGEHKIPFLVVCDAFQSEMVAFADLVLPDTSYLERFDAMSMLDRPISEFDGAMDSVRVPVVPALGACRPFQEVLIELASRLGFPAFTAADGSRKYKGYTDFIVNFETAPGSGVGFLSGWRGKDGSKTLKGEPNPEQWERYAENDCVHYTPLPENLRYLRGVNRDYLRYAKEMGWRRRDDPVVIAIYSEVLQKFRLAARGRTEEAAVASPVQPRRQPPAHLRARIAHHFDPLPFWEPPLEQAQTDAAAFPLAAVTQRPMAMYHAWDAQNAWLRQIHGHNPLFVHPHTASQAGVEDGAWLWVESPWGRVRCVAQYSEAVEPGTVWTWNAIGKASGAWGLQPGAAESRRGFLLNHLITDELPGRPGAPGPLSNSDPITGQAGWYDVRVRLLPADAPEMAAGEDAYAAVHGAPLPQAADMLHAVDADASWPRHTALPRTPGQHAGVPSNPKSREQVLRYFAGRMHQATATQPKARP
ncbi:MAG: molybdopterin oxidoreductase family protein [Betaproteobacteria bacterium]|nr:molybdopterin oxidoreductase family protein [Betaproteobacteria bacterium]MDE2185300.1 molybdopterin oxidoreductase family protein [Betaproteobacteria bacterium]MDE2324374.1 molybdopterin oxidoreductase family protein [Betaproteobacteria bacterium]